jgi:5'(3')-deoxyribonucleotidase
MWAAIDTVPTFFRDLPVIPGALEFFEQIKHLHPIILTSCPASNYPHVADQKHAWVREHLGDDVLVLPVNGSESKPRFLQHHGDVLIDDWGKNIRAWEQQGGIGLKYEGDFGEILWQLRKIYDQDVSDYGGWFKEGVRKLKAALS